MTGRPYFNHSITALERLFFEHSSEVSALKLLLHELKFRTTQRAEALQREVSFALARVESDTHQMAGGTQNSNGQLHPDVDSEPPSRGEENPESGGCTTARTVAERTPAGPKPPINNRPEDILRAWTALEVLSPQSFRQERDLVAGREKRVARFDRDRLPWEKNERSLPRKRLYYELILGTIELPSAVDALLSVYADKRPDRPSGKGRSVIASVMLDKHGCPLEEESSVAISSFAWGVPIALRGDLRVLGDWPNREQELLVSLRKELIRKTRDGEVISLTKNRITDVFKRLVDMLHLQTLQIRQPSFVLRHYEYFASKVPPEPGLLNSFYLEDLAAVQQLAHDGSLSGALRHYLGADVPEHRTDLLHDHAGLRDLLQPARTPLGRWPALNNFPLALLQQAAVNASSGALMSTGILAVNGPPGTGKTTLLRDVVADRIVQRAQAMCAFDDPRDALIPSRHSVQRQGARITLHTVDDRLKGYEMVVVSSNNKAVENVSAELPAMNAIASEAQNLRYFSTIASKVLQRDCWGLISAVLGNRSNLYRFVQPFWRDEEHGLSTYLNHVCGMPQVVSERQDDGSVRRRWRAVVQEEDPPANPREAMKRWHAARERFVQAQARAERCLQQLQQYHEDLVRSERIGPEIKEISGHLDQLRSAAAGLNSQHQRARRELDAITEDRHSWASRMDLHAKSRPGFFARWFARRRYGQWQDQFKHLKRQLEVAGASQQNAIRETEESFAALQSVQADVTAVERRFGALLDEQDALQERLQECRGSLDAAIPDARFFSGEHERMQVAHLWFGARANRFRADVFEAAIHLHRAFVDASAERLRQNLAIFTESFGTRSLGNSQKDAMLPELWASFFLVVPVVSTTFASVRRMFARLPAQALGWLLVDEAGQALPQAAVGALLRARHAVVVGDPLQVEPVVTLPERLTEEICEFFGVDPLRYNAPQASVQTLADAASVYCARFPSGSGYRDVGAPLLVHRRCSSPMFDISNEIAYANMMVQAKPNNAARSVLGRSQWIDVVGDGGPDKWCADEATALLGLLWKLRNSGAQADLYIVTPFVIVQDNLRREVANSGVLDGWIGDVAPWSWVYEHIGTVHTVQGREAAIVFFVLGAQKTNQHGARAWAGGTPNLANVAVTRAKESLYVIGNRQLWKYAGVFSVLDRLL